MTRAGAAIDDPRVRTDFRRAMLAWFRASARDLPWRRTRDPYAIWLSEIMLQQTRVETVTPYYERFLAAFPTVGELAAAPLERVLKAWEGLGYYRRARHLHAAAQAVVRDHGGAFPRTAAELVALPGIGRYTAGAIASIAFQEPTCAVDGNIQRVLARVMHVTGPLHRPDTQRRLWECAAQLLPRRQPGDFNQAMMELGARLCTPRKPQCGACPVGRWCVARARGDAEKLPARVHRPDVPQVRAVAAVLRRRGRFAVVQRSADGLLAGLWTLPQVEVPAGGRADTVLREYLAGLGLGATVCAPLARVKHTFTHRRLCVELWRCELQWNGGRAGGFQWRTLAAIADLPAAAIDRKLFAHLG